jgi:hypothetical protein
MMKLKHHLSVRPVLGAMLLAVWLGPSLAIAAGDNQTVRTQYDGAVELYSQKQYESCRKTLLELWSNNKTHDIATLLGQVENKLGHFADSATYYAHAIANFPPTEDRKQLETIKGRFRETQKKVMKLDVKTNVDGATITVDGVDVASPPLFLDSGLHLVFVRKDGYKTADKRIDAKAGTTESWNVTLVANEVATEPAPTKTTSSPVVGIQPFNDPPKDTLDSKPNPWILVGGGVVTVGVLVTGLVFNAKASNAKSDGERLRDIIAPGVCVNPTVTLEPDCRALRDSADNSDKYRSYSTIGFVVSGVAAAGTIAYWLWPRQKPTSNTQGFIVDGGFGKTAGILRVTASF